MSQEDGNESGHGDGSAGVVRLMLVLRAVAAQVAEERQRVEALQAAVAAASREKSILLSNISDGLVTLGRDGRMSAELSTMLAVWLGPPGPEQTFWGYIEEIDPPASSLFRLGWEALSEDFLPMEVVLAQMPRQMHMGSQVLRIEYRPILVKEQLDRMLLILTDITSEIERERLEAEQQELVAAIDKLIRNREAFRDFWTEATSLVRRLIAIEQRPLEETRRLVHTLKGNAGLFGLSSVATLCHDIETRMVESADDLSARDREELARRWRSVSERLGKLIGSGSEGRIEIRHGEYDAVLSGVLAGAPRQQVAQMMKRWRFQPLQDRLEQLADHARDLARRLGKGPIEVCVEAGELRIPADRFAGFFSALVHVIRNAVDHGLEGAEEREALGKSSQARIDLTAFIDRAGGDLVLQIADDGRGVDWRRLRQRALARGLPAESQTDLTEALFSDGVSTKDEVTDLSGRGVGMGAVRVACATLGGAVRVASEQGRGSVFSFRFPPAAIG